MVKLIGFVLFWIAVGMIIGLLMTNIFLAIIIILLLMLLGYNLFISGC